MRFLLAFSTLALVQAFTIVPSKYNNVVTRSIQLTATTSSSSSSSLLNDADAMDRRDFMGKSIAALVFGVSPPSLADDEGEAVVVSFSDVPVEVAPEEAAPAATEEATLAAAPEESAAVAAPAAVADEEAVVTASAVEEAPVAVAGLDYKAVSQDIAALVKANPDWGPTLVRLAWHSSGTYDKISKTGGSGLGTIRFKEELAHGGNAGLGDTAVVWLEPIYEKYASKGLSYADLYTLAGVTVIKTLGGPTIPWSFGRADALDPSAVTPDGRLPNADSGPAGADKKDAAHLRSIFNRMGFDDREIVALSGAHALGRCHTTASGYDGPWTFTPTTFNNAYFTLLLNLKWTPKEWTGPFQYVDSGTGRLMMLPTDLVLIKDRKFRKWVEVYAKDGKKFDQDFSDAFHKLLELGTSNLTPVEWA